MRKPLAVVLGTLLTLTACGGGGDPDGGARLDGGAPDGGDIDGGPADGGPRDASDCASDPMAEGCACGDPGVVTCMGAGGIECCHGAWNWFLDGPCRGAPDAGTLSCDTPEVGCPCETAGEIACRTFLQWRLVCEDGIWAEEHGRICC